MSDNDDVEAERIKKAVKLVARCPILSIKQAMLASGFLENDAASRSMQMKTMMELQDANDLAVYTLTGAGYCGGVLKANLKETTTKEPITERN